ncbi:MAG: DUF4290 domain-containing protein [Alistipes sp.]|nr:DUF4290 domain-containing protein [Alistipes sp.]
MNKNYNYLRQPLLIPEYGRHIQEMINSLLEIEDREERTRQAKAVIAVMGNLNPLLRDTADFTHKLWDHLFIMSDFRLDVDSPYPQPSREDLQVKPRRLAYSQGGISHKHYGKNVVAMLNRIAEDSSIDNAATALGNITQYMLARSVEYNQDHPDNETIIKDVKSLTKGAIELDEESLKKIQSTYKTAQSSHSTSKGGKRSQRATTKNRTKSSARHNTHK